jgi:hypothetical protein
MKKLFMISSFIYCSLLFGADTLLESQQAAKQSVGQGVQQNQSYPYIYGVHQMNLTGVGTPLINYILGTISSSPVALINTTGMIGTATLPMISQFTLLVSPSKYNSALPSDENLFIKNVNLFGTIQSAIDKAVQDPNNSTTLSRWTILVEGGTYLENLTIQRPGPLPTQTISITLAALGTVTLGDGVATGNVTWFVAKNPTIPGGSARYPSLLFTVYRTNDTNYNARWIINKNYTVTRSTADTFLMQLHYVTLNGTLTTDPLRIDFFECVFAKPVSISPLNISSAIYGMQGCLFKDVVQTYYYSKVVGCVFQNGMQCQSFSASNSATEGVAGFFRCKMTGTFSMAGVGANDYYYVDPFSDITGATIPRLQLMQ